MSTTYLVMVNHVLRRLRVDEVTGVADNAYAKMVGDYVNDAKRTVENAYDWNALRTAITVTTSASTSEYTITGSKERPKVIDAINDTSNWFLKYRSPAWMDNAYFISTAPEAPPDSYTFNGVDSSEDTKIKLYPTPDGVYSLRFYLLVRPADWSSDSDTVDIPFAPIIHTAIALLARERGETGGTSAQEYFYLADRYLSDAIALDSAKNPEELVYSVA